jgi:hypothetical protein
MAGNTTPETATPTGQLTPELIKQIHALPRDTKEQLIIWLQEELDGGPFVGDLPEPPADDPHAVKAAWKAEIARRIEDMRTGRVEAIDAQGSAARLVQKMLKKYGPAA